MSAAELARPTAAAGRTVRRVLRHRPALVGFVMLVLVMLAAVAGPAMSSYSPVKPEIRARSQPPSAAHWFGTDDYGRDVFTRVVYGARYSLALGGSVVVVAAGLGSLLGLVSGYYGGIWDTVLMRLMDALMAFPDILLAIAVMAIMGPGIGNVVVALGVLYTPRFARLVRSVTLSLREQEFVVATRSLGGASSRLIFRHILPNTLPPLLVQGTIYFAYAILAEATLSFLGLGAPPPAPTWGNMLYDARQFLRDAPWMALFPGGAISFCVLAVNLAGDGLRDLLDPRLR